MIRPPVIAAWGAGVDSTAMIVELAEQGEPIDMVLFADPGSEKTQTYAFIPLFRAWMEARGISSEIVRYRPRNFKHWPPYATIAENMLSNATLPSVVFGGGSCSQKWKVAAQETWTASWEPARRCWDGGGRVTKLIGYDASARDTQRYRHALGCEDPRYLYRYPLREWGWDRERCAARIAAAGLPVLSKSSCFFCGAIKPDEVIDLSADELRIIVLMEARARPRLRNVQGLWRKPVLGHRGATPRPGSITEFIRERGLLPPAEIDRIVEGAPTELLDFQAAQAGLPLEKRTPMGDWLRDFQRAAVALRTPREACQMGASAHRMSVVSTKEDRMPRYNHLVTITFSIVSDNERGEDFTPAMLKEALFARIRDLDSSTEGVEWLEAVGAPCDTYEEEPLMLSDP